MKLTIRDVAKLLKVPENIIYGWITHEELPAYKMNDQYRINQTELMEWAASRKIPVPSTLVRNNKPAAALSLSHALEKGGIVYDVKGGAKEDVLRAVVQIMKLPRDMDRNNFFQILLAREALASTGVGHGIAIPHVRNPIIVPVLHPTVTLCFLDQPVDFGSLDGIPVHTLFTLLSPTIHDHLYLISRLSFALLDEKFKSVIKSRGKREEIMSALREVEIRLEPPPKGTGKA